MEGYREGRIEGYRELVILKNVKRRLDKGWMYEWMIV